MPVELGPDLALNVGDRVTVGLRAEELAFQPLNSSVDASTNATIITTLPTGTDWYYRVKFEEHEVMVRDNDHPGLRSGEEVRLAALPSPIKVFGADGRLILAPAGSQVGGAVVNSQKHISSGSEVSL